MRQIPSVTETTVPCVRTSVDAPRPSIRAFSSSLISDGLSCMFQTPESCYLASSGGQRIAHARQLGLHRSVKYLVTHDHAHTADQIGIHGDGRLELEAELFFQPCDQLLELFVADWKSTANFCQRSSFELVFEKLELLCNLGQCQNTVVVDKQRDEITSGIGQRRLDQTGEELYALRRIEPRICHRLVDVAYAH